MINYVKDVGLEALIFIEDQDFTKERQAILAEAEYFAFQLWLAENPEAGDLMPHSGGCRKVRWTVKGRGKRGGARIIYFYRLSASQILLLKIYAKTDKVNLPPKETEALKKKLL